MLLSLIFSLSFSFHRNVVAASAQIAQIHSCEIISSDTIKISGTIEGIQEPIYLFEMKSWEKNITNPIAEIPVTGNTFECVISLESRLFSKFVVGTSDGLGGYIAISEAKFLNPEGLATQTDPFPNAESKKGLLTNASMMEDVRELGVKHSLVNLDLGQLLTNGDMPISFDGTTCYINSGMLYGYDAVLKSLSQQNIVTSLVLLATPCPYPIVAQDTQATYEALDMQNPEGVKTLQTLIHFLAQRYTRSDKAFGQVVNWIVGNEVNNPSEWNGSQLSTEEYLANYADGVRMVSTAVRSVYSNARIYVSLDHCWNTEVGNRINAMNLLTYLYSQLNDIDWNIAYHAYPYLLNNPATWTDPVTDEITTDVISMKNIHVLTDYLAKNQMNNPDGSLKRVILSEVGFHAKDELLQAAAFAYSYYQAEANPLIDSIILSRQVDHSIEVNQGLSFGIWNTDLSQFGEVPTTKRYIWNVFKEIDTQTGEAVTSFALPIIGVSNWSDVINTNYNYGMDKDTVTIQPLQQTISKVGVNQLQISKLSLAGYQVSIPLQATDIKKVWFPTWTVQDGQDDLIWLEGMIQQDATGYHAVCDINTNDFQSKTGIYITHIYTESSNGQLSLLDGTEIVVPEESISNLSVSQEADGYTVSANYSNAGNIKAIWFPSWTTQNGQDDLVWKQGIISGNTISCFVPTSEHKNESGTYITHIYAEDYSGTYHLLDGIETVIQGNVLSNLSVSQETDGYLVSANYSAVNEIKEVWFPSWTIQNGQDDLVWKRGTISGNTISCFIPISEHGNESGTYITHIYTVDNFGTYHLLDGVETIIQRNVISNLSVSQGTDGYTISANYSDAGNMKAIWFPSWTTQSGQDDLVWKQGTISGNTISCFIPISEHKNERGSYITHIYAEDYSGTYHLLDGVETVIQGNGNTDASNVFVLKFPLKCNYTLTSAFGPRPNKPIAGVDEFHHGADFAATYGSEVFAAADGIVTYVGDGSDIGATGCGNQVWISHNNGQYMSIYNHLSLINVKLGQTVIAGKDVIGAVGMTGLATGPHLDFRIYIPAQYARYDTVQGDYVDPLSGDYLDKNGTRYPEVTIVYQ